ncbi:MAG TPA: hypothetical protein VMT20_15300 [Terriglobia bacterium]|nr:hypothetical protein [Terriglobia bacterium]
MSLFNIAGPGQGLPTNVGANQFNTPGQPWAAPGPNKIGLYSGQSILIPAGEYIINPGVYSSIQYLDPVSGVWANFETGAAAGNGRWINSDGVNWRIINTASCPISGTVTAAGSGYTSTPTVTSSVGGSLWTAVVGGAVSSSFTIGTAGSGYQQPPLVLFDAPPAGGVQATGYATITSGAVTAITLINAGAGYTTAPGITFVTSQTDEGTAIVSAAATCVLTGANTVTAVLLQNPGLPEASAPTLTITGGGGSSATATATMNGSTAEADTIVIQPA